jgi:hypothetical protein
MSYQDLIRRDLAHRGLISMDPRHVEASMRCVFGTLDHLGGLEWTAAVREAVAEVQTMGPEMSEALAQSWGLIGKGGQHDQACEERRQPLRRLPGVTLAR